MFVFGSEDETWAEAALSLWRPQVLGTGLTESLAVPAPNARAGCR